MSEDDIGSMVNKLIMSLNDLSNGLQDPKVRPLIVREREDLSLASAQLKRLLRRMDEPVAPVNQPTLMEAAE
jgi:hypothetical protein